MTMVMPSASRQPTASHGPGVPPGLRTVFLDDGREVLDDQGRSALLHNLRVLAASSADAAPAQQLPQAATGADEFARARLPRRPRCRRLRSGATRRPSAATARASSRSSFGCACTRACCRAPTAASTAAACRAPSQTGAARRRAAARRCKTRPPPSRATARSCTARRAAPTTAATISWPVQSPWRGRRRRPSRSTDRPRTTTTPPTRPPRPTTTRARCRCSARTASSTPTCRP